MKKKKVYILTKQKRCNKVNKYKNQSSNTPSFGLFDKNIRMGRKEKNRMSFFGHKVFPVQRVKIAKKVFSEDFLEKRENLEVLWQFNQN